MADLETLPPELPPEVTNAQVEQYLYRLIELTTDRIRQRADAIVPPEAVDFIGEERVILNEKIHLIIQMGLWMVDAIHESEREESREQPVRDPAEKIEDENEKIKALNKTIKAFLSSSTDPVQSLAYISRIWKYLKDTAHTPYNPEEYRLGVSNFLSVLHRYADEHNLPPFTQAEKQDLFSVINDWKLGKPAAEILRMLDRRIEAASSRSSFPTRASREYARNRGIDRDALGRHVQHLREIKAFLEKLFQKG
jgi:hypothetical protein